MKVSLCLSQLSEDMFSSRISVTDVPARALFWACIAAYIPSIGI